MELNKEMSMKLNKMKDKNWPKITIDYLMKQKDWNMGSGDGVRVV